VGCEFNGEHVRKLFHISKKIELTKQADSNPNTHKPFRRDIQALRAFAVIAVVLYHLWPNHMIGGFAGVDIFFVISGYLMTTSIMRRLGPLADKHNINVKSVANLLTEFYARRIKRLVPAALTALLGILALSQLTGNLNVIITNAKNAISAATFWQNWFLANDSLNYLQQDNLIVATQHFWSLSLEEQFYLMWPLLLVIGTLVTVGVTVLYKKNKIRGLILPITLVTIGSLAYGVWLTKTNPTLAYYSTPARVWELMIGGIIAFLPAIRSYDLKLLVPYVGLMLNIFSIFYIGAEGFPGWWALIPTVGTAMIIWGGVDRYESRLSFDNMFSWRPIQWTGDISYSIYLWHFPLIILLPIILHMDIDGAHGRLLKISIIALSFIVAWLSYKFIEQSTQHLKLKTRYVYLLFVIATTTVVALSFYIKYTAQTQVQANLNAMHKTVLNLNEDCVGARAVLHQNKCGNPYGVANNGFMNVGREEIWGDVIQSNKTNCYLFYLEQGRNDVTRYCEVGNLDSSKQIAVVGDSHAEQYINTFNAIGLKYGYKANIYTLGTCSTNAFTDNTSKGVCQSRLDFILKSLNKNSSIIVSTAFKNDTNVDKILKLVNNNTDKPVILLNDEPRTTEKRLSSCYTTRVDCTNTKEFSTQDISSTLDRLLNNGLVKKNNVIDLTKALCDNNYCYSSIGGLPVYYNTKSAGRIYDNSHIAPSYSLTMAPIIGQALAQDGFLK